jgi:hypothetical protein
MDDGKKAENSEPPAPAPDGDQAGDLDSAESPADVRVTFIVLMLAAATLCAIPQQWVSAGILLVMAILGGLFHFAKRRRA